MDQHSEQSAHAGHAAQAGHHIDSVRTYALVLVTLLCLTIATALVATIDLGFFNIVLALGIAVTKMMFVVWFFMHVRYSTTLTRLVMVSGLLWLMILLTLSFADFATRGWLNVLG
jgi:cytochrome c oxidase subunit IV